MESTDPESNQPAGRDAREELAPDELSRAGVAANSFARLDDGDAGRSKRLLNGSGLASQTRMAAWGPELDKRSGMAAAVVADQTAAVRGLAAGMVAGPLADWQLGLGTIQPDTSAWTGLLGDTITHHAASQAAAIGRSMAHLNNDAVSLSAIRTGIIADQAALLRGMSAGLAGPISDSLSRLAASHVAAMGGLVPRHEDFIAAAALAEDWMRSAEGRLRGGWDSDVHGSPPSAAPKVGRGVDEGFVLALGLAMYLIVNAPGWVMQAVAARPMTPDEQVAFWRAAFEALGALGILRGGHAFAVGAWWSLVGWASGSGEDWADR